VVFGWGLLEMSTNRRGVEAAVNAIRRRGAASTSNTDELIDVLETLLHHKRAVQQVKAQMQMHEDRYHRVSALLADDLRRAEKALDDAAAEVVQP
jgi:hypothetical protein